MRISEFEWDEENISHIAKHGVEPGEVEEACFLKPFVLRAKFGRYFILGQSESGRYLAVVIAYKGKGIVRVITARDADEAERKRYIRR